MQPIYFCVTGSEIIPQDQYHQLRKAEYHVAFERIKIYKYPILIVCSEQEKDITISNLIKSILPYKYYLDIDSTDKLGARTKSQKEYISMYELLKQCDFLKPNDWIIKISGRYLIVEDTLLSEVQKAPEDIQFIGRISPNNQIHTYFYAIRYNVLELFLSKGVHYLADKCVEKVLFDFFQENQIKVKYIDRLGIFTNVANNSEYVLS
jgi:hypothetical protein